MKLILSLFFLFSTLVFAEDKPHRVIALSPALTELIYALNFGQLLVGVSDFSDYPDAAKKLPSVGPYTKPNFEKILALKSDVIFLPLEGPEDVKKHLDSLNLKYVVISMRKLKEIGVSAVKISEVLGDRSLGEDFARNFNIKIENLFLAPHKKIKSVFIEVQKDPLIAAGRGTFLNEIVSGCGGNNIIEERNYPKISLEKMAIQDLDVVLLADFFNSPKEKEATIKWWMNRPHPQKKIEALNPDTAARPGPRLLTGIKDICKALE